MRPEGHPPTLGGGGIKQGQRMSKTLMLESHRLPSQDSNSYSTLKYIPDTPWDCHICQSIDPPGTTPIGSPMVPFVASGYEPPHADPLFGSQERPTCHLGVMFGNPTLPTKGLIMPGSSWTWVSWLDYPTLRKQVSRQGTHWKC